MPTSSPEIQWMVHPDIVTSAIKWLAGVVGLIGGALVTVLTYIWHQHEKRQEMHEQKQETRWGEFTSALGELSSSLSSFKEIIEHRMTAQETICKERGKHCPMYRRKGDREPEYEV